ncbi:MAG: exosortase H-associated membrane protein [Halothiobacillus sp.]
MKISLMSGFLLRAIFWLILCLLGWYVLGGFLTVPVGWLAGSLMHGLFPAWVDGFELHGTKIDLLTSLQLPAQPGMPPDQVALLTPEASYLTYGFGLPLMMALFLASMPRRTALKMAVAALALQPFQVFSIMFSWLKDVAIVAGPEVVSQTGFGEFGREAIALGYQFGTLILPTLAPVVLWLMLDRSLLARAGVAFPNKSDDESVFTREG